MGLHIEIDGGASLREWTAVGVIALFMCGQEAAAAQLAAQLAPTALGKVPTAAPIPAPPAATPTNPAQLADALIAAAEAKRATAAPTVAGEPLPADEGEDELPVVPVAERPGAAVPLDTAGRPHDNRIHAATKTTNKDGTWRYLRGVDKDLIAQVEAELDAVMRAPVPPAPPSGQESPVPEVSEGPVVTDPAAAFGGPGNAAAVPAPPVTPAAIPAPPATNGPAVPTPASPSSPDTSGTNGAAEFARIMRVVVEKQKAGMPTETTTTIAQQLGITSVRDLVKRPDLIPAFEALLP